MVYNRLSCENLKDKINSRVFLKFMCKDRTIKLQRDKTKEYIQITMCDRDIEQKNVRLFNATEEQKKMIQNGKIYEAAIDVREYNESSEGYSCIIYNIQEAESEDPNEYIEWENGVNEAIEYINVTLNNIVEYSLFKIVYSIMLENWERFTRWAAASSIHHSKLGGLAVHTAETIKTCELIAEFYTERYGEGLVDIDLLRASAMLHDVGKCYELCTDIVSGTVEYSTEASMETHIMWILSEIDKKSVQGGFNEDNAFTEDIMLLKHCIASHHGKLEYGSPIEPNIVEAVILSYADKISADIYVMNRDSKDIEEGESKTYWSSGKMKSIYKPKGR